MLTTFYHFNRMNNRPTPAAEISDTLWLVFCQKKERKYKKTFLLWNIYVNIFGTNKYS